MSHPEDDPPTLPPGYALQALIGAGGMGRVYLAHDVKHDRRVAVKVMSSAVATGVVAERFLREVRTLAGLVHPNIVPLYDSGECAGQLFYVMPYVEGRTLRKRLQQEIQFPVEKVLTWAAELADALSYAHRLGLIHRDIKPENVLLQADHAMIADFGIARAVDLAGDALTGQGVAVGTPAYMSPEQASGQSRLDARSDVYSLGCVVYELLVGEPPFTGPTLSAITARKLAAQYSPVTTARPLVPASVERALARALQPVAADRFATVDDFCHALVDRPRSIFRRAPAVLLASAVGAAAIWAGVEWMRPGGAVRTDNRVVVALFANQTADSRHDRLRAMAADWVTDGLQRTEVLDVVPSATALASARYLATRNDVDPVAAIAEETGARFVITGSIDRDRDSLTLRAQLSDASTGLLVGAIEPIRTPEENPSPGLEHLRARVMGLLSLRLDERIGQVKSQPVKPPVYEAYKAFSEGLDAYIREDDRPALAAFQRAYRLDSTFVLSLLYISLCYNNDARFAEADSVLRVLAEHRDELSAYDRYWLDYSQAEARGDNLAALIAIREADRLAPGSKAAYNFALQALQSRQVVVAESALKRLSPDRGPMRGWVPYWKILTDALHAQGKHEAELRSAHDARVRYSDQPSVYTLELRALAALHRGPELDELLANAERRLGGTHAEYGTLLLEVASELRAHGDTARSRALLERARAHFRQSPSTDSVDAKWGLLQVSIYEGAWSDATRLGKELVAQYPARTSFKGAYAIALARTGDSLRARRILDDLSRDQATYPVGFTQFEAARVAAALGDSTVGRRLIERAAARGYPFNSGTHHDPVLGALRHHPLLGPMDARRD